MVPTETPLLPDATASAQLDPSHPAGEAEVPDDGNLSSSSSGEESEENEECKEEGSQGGKQRASQGRSGREPKRSRRYQFKPVRATARCGVCKTCLNPGLKKACETVRKQQEVRQQREGALSRSRSRSVSPPKPPIPTPGAGRGGAAGGTAW